MGGFPITKKQKAIVCFAGETEIKALKLLKKGFRHCFVVFNDGENWISIDPLSNHMDIKKLHVQSDFELGGWLKTRGYKVVETYIDRSKTTIAPLLPFTCVEGVKRFLGIHSWAVITPYQLYKYLMKKGSVA